MSRIVLDAQLPKHLMRRPPPGPLASVSQRPTVVAKAYPKTMARITQPPVRREPRRYPAYPLFDWEPRFRWKDLLPYLLMAVFFVTLFLEVERLEHEQMSRLDTCPTAVTAREP